MKAACDWSILGGRLTGKNQPANLQSCTGQPPCWLSVNQSHELKVIGPLWLLRDLQSSTSWRVLIEVWLVAWAWLNISLGEPNAML